MAAPKRAPLDVGLIPAKHKDNQASVGQASMTPDKPEPAAQVEAKAPAAVKLVEEPAGEHPVKTEPAPKPEPTQQAAEPEPSPSTAVVEPAPAAEPEAKAALLPSSEAAPAATGLLDNFPRHARSATSETQQLSCKVGGQRLERYLEARHRTRLTGQEIITEALDIWLAHNGF